MVSGIINIIVIAHIRLWWFVEKGET